MMEILSSSESGNFLLKKRAFRVAALFIIFFFACVLKNAGVLQQANVYRIEFNSNYAAALAAKAGADIYSPEKVAPLAGEAGVTGFLFPYANSPFAAYSMIPLTWFTSKTAQSAWLWISVLIAAFTLTILADASLRFAPADNKSKNVILFAFAGITFLYFLPFTNNLELGEISIVCVMFLALSFLFSVRGNNFASGFFIGCACLFNGPLMVFLVYFIARKKYRALAGAASAFIVSAAFVSALGGWRLWPEYFTGVFRTFTGAVQGGPVPSDVNNLSLFGFLTRLFGTGTSASLLYACIAVATLAALFLWTRKLKTEKAADAALLPFSGLAIILAPAAFVYHIPLLLPALFIAFARIWTGCETGTKTLFAALFGALAFFAGIMFPRFYSSIWIPGWCAPFVTSLSLWFILGLCIAGIVAARKLSGGNKSPEPASVASNPAAEFLSFSRHSLLIICIAFIGIVALVILIRINYPFELEWLEGETLQMSKRVMDGGALYTKPGIEFTPAIYTPFFFYVGALFSTVFGLTLPALRLISLLSFIGALWLIYAFVKKETSSGFWGVIAAGFFAATFRQAGAWFDIARIDMLFLVLVLASSYIARWAPSPKMLIAAGFLMFLAFFTKQSGILPALGISFYLFLMDRRKSLYFIFSFWPAVAAGVILLTFLSGGWFYYFVFDLPSQQKTMEWLYAGFWKFDVMGRSPILSILALAFIFILIAKKAREPLQFYSILAASVLISSWLMRLKIGGYENAMVPVFALAAIMAASAAASLTKFMQDISTDDIRKYLSAAFIFIACSIQMLTLSYNIPEQIPNKADYHAGNEVVEKIKSIDGEVWVPAAGYLAIMAGKGSYMHLMTYVDICEGKPDSPVRKDLDRDISEALASGRFAAVITHDDDRLKGEILKHYNPAGAIIQNKDDFVPVTGSGVRPNQVFLRK